MTRMLSALVRALIVSLTFVKPAAAQELLPLDRFTRIDALHEIKISPDGDFLAFTTGHDGPESLRFFNLRDNKIEANARAPEGLVIADFQWASDTQVMFRLTRRGRRAEDPASSALYSIDRHGRKQARISSQQSAASTTTGTILPPSEVQPATLEIVSAGGRNTGTILVSETPWRAMGTSFVYDPNIKPWLTSVDLDTGIQTRVEQVPLPNASIIVDSNDRPRFAVSRNKTSKTRFGWKRTQDASWEVFELGGFRSDTVRARRFAPDDRSILFTAVADGERHAALYELDPSSRSVKKLIGLSDADVDDLLVDPTTRETIGVAANTEKPLYGWLRADHPIAQLQQSPPPELAGSNVRIGNFTANGRRALVISETETASRAFFLFDTERKQLAPLARAWLRPEAFARPDEFATMKITPDGKALAVTSRIDAGELLSFLTIGDPKPVEILRTDDGSFIHDFFWASNERAIFTTAQHDLGRFAPRRGGEIFAIDRSGLNFAKIYGSRDEIGEKRTTVEIPIANDAAADVVSLLDKDDRNILVATMPRRAHWLRRSYDPDGKPRLVRLDIHNGGREALDQAPLSSATFIVDHADQPRFAVGVNTASKQAVAWKRTPRSPWEEFELPGFRDGTVRPLRFTPNDRSVLLTAVPEAQRYAALFELDLDSRVVKQLLDIPSTDIIDLVTDPASKEPVGVIGYTDKLVYRWLRPDHPAVRTAQSILRAFEGSEVRFVSHSADGNRAIVFVQSDVAPGEYFLFDAKAKRADMIAPARKWIDARTMRPKESIAFKARDGLSLHGYLTRPRGGAPHPLVVLPHGGPHQVRDTWGFDAQVQLLASRGYAVLQVNYRGSGGYGVDFERAGYGEWGAKMQDDITDAVRWTIEQKVADPERICIYGVTFGGYAALMGAAREPELYRCAVGFAGIYDLELLTASESTAQSQVGSQYFDTILGNDPETLRARSPAHLAPAISAAVLLIHGEERLLAPDEQTLRMKVAMERAGNPVETLRPFAGDHKMYDASTRARVYQTLLEFLDRHLMDAQLAGSAQRASE